MYDNAFAVKYDVKGEVLCNTKTFGSDPQPGKAKQCFCDDIEFEYKEDVQEELAYWSEQKEVANIKDQAEKQEIEMASSADTV